MSDFTSSFWSFYVAILTLGSIGYCAWLLWKMSRAKLPAGQTTQAKAAGKTVELTGHTWDEDLAEYNNPLPRWWMWLFWITIVFALGYLVLYPGLGSNDGVLKWSSSRAWGDEREATEARIKPLYDKYLAMDVKQVAADPQAHAMGERLFLNNCAQCHGSDAAGGKGYPNLRDTDWLYGGDPDTIKTSIMNGRNGVMPALGPAIGEENVRNVVHYVRSLSGLPHDGLKAQLGKAVFMQNCSACHGADGTGNKAVGAPNLTDKIWLYGSSEQTITETVMKGRGSSTLAEGQSAMPAWKDKLGEGKVHVLAAYVWSLSNTPSAAAAK
jgi:cytochrome c oxidase cbb3-type subunit 3